MGERAQEAAVCAVPQPDLAVTAARGDDAVAGRDGNGADAILVPREGGDLPAVADRPQLERGVLAARDDALPVRREADAVDEPLVPLQVVEELAALDIPDAGRE